jgi:hypothetical protein
MGIDGFVTFKLIDMDGFATFALTGRDGFVTHPYEFVIVRKGYKPFPTFDCVVGGKPLPINLKVENPYPLIQEWKVI